MTDKELNALLVQIEYKAAIVRDQVCAVVAGHPAFFLCGPAGHGKSYAVVKHLDQLLGRGNWCHHNSRVTGRALFESLAEFPEHVHLYEDCEHLFQSSHNPIAAGILRSACGSPDRRPRIVTYETAHGREQIDFRGGIIITSNNPLGKSGVAAALASRFGPIEWRLSVAERLAIILSSARKGYTRQEMHLTVKQCLDIASFLEDEAEHGRDIDLRSYFDHGIPVYHLWQSGGAKAHWRDVLRAKIRGEIVPESRAERLNKERLTAAECKKTGTSPAECVSRWIKKTGLKKTAYYDRLREAKQMGLI